jgi:hypothetical protein
MRIIKMQVLRAKYLNQTVSIVLCKDMQVSELVEVVSAGLRIDASKEIIGFTDRNGMEHSHY